jgi:hypothetical protein
MGMAYLFECILDMGASAVSYVWISIVCEKKVGVKMSVLEQTCCSNGFQGFAGNVIT